jgi:TonB family protein
MALSRFAIAAMMFALAGPATLAQDAGQPPTSNSLQNSAGTPVTDAYPVTTDGLRELLQQLVAAIQKGDTQETSRIRQSLAVPDYKAWFAQVFGAATGDNVAELYTASLRGPAPDVSDSLRGVVQDGKTNIRVKRFEPTDDSLPEWYVRPLATAMQKPTALYRADAYKDQESSWNFPGYFFYVDGGFRFVSLYAFRDVPGVMPARIRVGGNVQAASITHFVQPTYPLDAKMKHIQGTVMLHAIIGKDGRITNLEFLGGPPELKKAAMDAVQKWIYKPTLLLGIPIEVDTTIRVEFRL